jgi:molybdate/tungstate transport system substrate-binding protein
MTRPFLLRWLAPLLFLTSIASYADDTPTLRVAYAGSMGVVMDESLGPAFAKAHNARYEGIGQGSFALARLLAAKQMQADVFIAITPGPIKVLQQAARIEHAVPIASTRMVVIYSPGSRYAADFVAAARGEKHWQDVLREPGVRLGRTDPAVDPQGANALLTLQLAERYYKQAGLLRQVAGELQNPSQIFAEPSLMSRLQAGQIDAAIGYASAAYSHHLPTIDLPDEINLAQPAMQEAWYAKASLHLADGKELKAQPLVFYAAVLSESRQPALAADFVHLLQASEGQAMLHERGYDPPHGDTL